MFISTRKPKLKPSTRLALILLVSLSLCSLLRASIDSASDDEGETKGAFINDSEGSVEDEEASEPVKPVEEDKSPALVESEDPLLKKKTGA